MDQRPDLEAIDQALQHIRESIHRTPVLTCSTIDQKVGAQLFFKCENFQKSGSFKFRGASHAVLSLDESQASRGVLTHSSGNYAAAAGRKHSTAEKETAGPESAKHPELFCWIDGFSSNHTSLQV